jgi:hypothetical protein
MVKRHHCLVVVVEGVVFACVEGLRFLVGREEVGVGDGEG